MASNLTTDHFRQLVRTETNRMNESCDEWTHIMDTETGITEEAFGQIRSTICKTHLFINQRFKQFIGLVDDCQYKRGPKETKVEDLQGFWDMIFYQVQDLHHSFQLLNQLKENKWCELQVVAPVVQKRAPKAVPKPVNNKTAAKPIVRSKIREQILNLKNANKECEQKSDKNESFGEKENQKISSSVVSSEAKKNESNGKSIEKHSEGVCNVLKRTPLRVAVKKWFV